MFSGKIVSFSVFGCILENALKNKIKNPHPNVTGIAQKPTTTTATHRDPPHKPTVSHPDPPQIKPPSESTKNLPRNPPRRTAQNQESSSKSTKSHQL
jgi:hypothetical protein